MTPEPYSVAGGPFDLLVRRDRDTVTMRVIGDKGDPIANIQFPASQIDNVIRALFDVRER